MLDVRLAQAFQPHGGDALGKPQKARLHVGWKGGDFPSDSFVEDFYPPSHQRRYISFLRYRQDGPAVARQQSVSKRLDFQRLRLYLTPAARMAPFVP